MRALVDDKCTRILLDSGANVSVITDTFAKKLRLRDVPDHGRRIDIQGISKGKVSTTRRAQVKITLGWEMVYELEMWVMVHSAGVDVVLGTDFMIPAGIQLDLFHGAAQLPNEIRIPLVKTKNMLDSEEYGSHMNAGRPSNWTYPGMSGESIGCQSGKWLTKFRRGRPKRIKLTNVSDWAVYFPAHDDIAVLVPAGDLPRGDGYVRVDSKKYRDWQVLAYEGCRDRELFQRECELYEQWLATQPPSVERPDYPESQEIATRPPQDSLEGPGDRLTCAERWEKIMEEGERPETCHASGVTIGDSVVVQRPESSSDGETAASRGVNITIEDSCRHAHGRRSNMKVVQPATNVRLESSADIGPPDLVTITLEGICPSDEPPTSCSMIFLSEDSATSPEVQDTTDEAIVPVPRVHSEVSGDTGVSAPVTATPGGICPGQGVPTSRAANIAIADLSVSTQRLKAMSTEMNPSLSSVASTLGRQRQRRSLWTKHVFRWPMCRVLPTLWICKNHFRCWPRKASTFRQFVQTLVCYVPSYHATTDDSSCRLTDR
ncbi:hypothetical protein PC123_g22990 [Phytophthora cactorum]|nr:hypothetical protein PC123_g22990 [Phytophthora cactorum]